MSELNTLFRKRIGLQKNDKIILKTLDNVLKKLQKQYRLKIYASFQIKQVI